MRIHFLEVAAMSHACKTNAAPRRASVSKVSARGHFFLTFGVSFL